MKKRGSTSNPVAIIVLAYAAATGASSYLGVHDIRCVALFVIAWMLPIPRMTLQSEPRSVQRVQNSTDKSQRYAVPFVILGALPWFALPWLHRTYRESVLWQSLNIPGWLWWIGAMVTGAFVLWPLVWRGFTNTISRRNDTEGRAGSAVVTRPQGGSPVGLTPYAIISVSMFLVSANLFIALVAAAGFAGLCLMKIGAARRHRGSTWLVELQHAGADPVVRQNAIADAAG